MSPGRTEAIGWAVVATPFALLLYHLNSGDFDAAPWRSAVHESGLWALRWTTIAVLVSPFVALTGIRAIEPARRALGLGAALYGFAHVWFWLRQYAFDWDFLLDEILRLFLLVGLAGTLLMVPLALTSNDYARKRLGMDLWRKIHLLVYPAAGAAWFHFALSIRIGRVELYLHAIGLLIALGHRLQRAFAKPR